MNPELRRNLWLEITPARLVIMPVVLFGVFVLASIGDGRPGPVMASAAITAFCLVTILWGSHLAAESVVGELRGRTWDWQRMSGQGAWALTWGKLLGATAYPWYGGVLCLAAFALAAPADGLPRLKVAAVLVVGALLAQAAALLAGLHVARRDRGVTRLPSASILVLGVVLLSSIVGAGVGRSAWSWYGIPAAGIDLVLATATALLAFALAGAWVQARRELQQRTLPVVWPAFVLFLAAWIPGFDPARDEWIVGERLALATGVTLALAWLTLFAERKDPVALTRLARAAAAGRWRRALEEAPAWLVSLPLAAGLVASLVALSPRLFPRTGAGGAVGLMALAALAFQGRDLALVLFLNLGRRPRRADLFAGVLLLVAYLLVPLLLDALGWKVGAALLLPSPDHAALSLASAALQAVLGGLVLTHRWRSRRAPAPTAPGPA